MNKFSPEQCTRTSALHYRLPLSATPLLSSPAFSIPSLPPIGEVDRLRGPLPHHCAESRLLLPTHQPTTRPPPVSQSARRSKWRSISLFQCPPGFAYLPRSQRQPSKPVTCLPTASSLSFQGAHTLISKDDRNTPAPLSEM